MINPKSLQTDLLGDFCVDASKIRDSRNIDSTIDDIFSELCKAGKISPSIALIIVEAKERRKKTESMALDDELSKARKRYIDLKCEELEKHLGRGKRKKPLNEYNP